jgi:hypothetical protein
MKDEWVLTNGSPAPKDAIDLAVSGFGEVIAYRPRPAPKIVHQRRYFWLNHSTGLVNLSSINHGLGFVDLKVTLGQTTTLEQYR